jgi:hypothetical protein
VTIARSKALEQGGRHPMDDGARGIHLAFQPAFSETGCNASQSTRERGDRMVERRLGESTVSTQTLAANWAVRHNKSKPRVDQIIGKRYARNRTYGLKGG